MMETFLTAARSACIAGGLIEAGCRTGTSIRSRRRSACIAGGLIEAAATRCRPPTCCGVPPVLQAASLKRR